MELLSPLLHHLHLQLQRATAPGPAGGQAGQAAVLVLLTNEPNPSLVYTKRARHLRLHAGEVSFPGGMWEPADGDLCVTALRETSEEIGLAPQAVQLLGQLAPGQTRKGTWVMPYVACYDPGQPLRANPAELEAIFRVPLASFTAGIQVREDEFERDGRRYTVPAYLYQDYEIWGFTAAVTAQLLRLLR